MQERTEKVVLTETYKGHRLIVREMRWGKEAHAIAPSMHDYYCGYVELLPDDYYFNHETAAEDELEIFGGITYTEEYGKLECLPQDGKFVGKETVKWDCENLIDQIIRKNGECHED